MSPAAPANRTLRLAALLLPALGFLLLGALWSADRTRSRERPRWDETDFIRLTTSRPEPGAWAERWVVAFHPGCPHCANSLASLAAARDRLGARVRVAALLVDVTAAPADSIVAGIPADEVFRDAAGRWRRRWGHRVYGEILCFESDGRLARVLAPFADEHDAASRLNAHRLQPPRDG